MDKGILEKILVLVIVFLFAGASLVSALKSDAVINKPGDLPDRGHIAYGFSGYGFVQFELDDPGNLIVITPNCSASGADFDDNGDLYFVTNIGGLYKIDYETGTVVLVANTIPFNGLTHDTTTDIWYACDNNNIYTIDINTGATTFVGDTGMTNIPIGLACDYDGDIYTYDVLFSGDSHLYSIDKTTGEATEIGDMGYGFCYGQDPAYDRDEGILYIAGYFNNGMPSALLTCDTQTGACTIVGNFQGGMEVDGFAIPYGNPNQYPRADFTWAPENPYEGGTIFFNASASYDPDGYITLYEWDWNNDGVYEESYTTPTATHSWGASGSYVVTLRVTDNASLTGKKSKTVEVEINPPPKPVIYGPDNGAINVEYTFCTDAIVDPEGDSFFAFWDWDDGTNSGWLGPYASGEPICAPHAWTEPGVYCIKVKIKDTGGTESEWSDPFCITISDTPLLTPPIIKGPTHGKIGISYNYTFNSTYIDGEPLGYMIDWGDGSHDVVTGLAGTETTANHTWTKRGPYVISARAKTPLGEISQAGTLKVTMPRTVSFNSVFLKFLERFPHAFPIIRNLIYLKGIVV